MISQIFLVTWKIIREQIYTIMFQDNFQNMKHNETCKNRFFKKKASLKINFAKFEDYLFMHNNFELILFS